MWTQTEVYGAVVLLATLLLMWMHREDTMKRKKIKQKIQLLSQVYTNGQFWIKICRICLARVFFSLNFFYAHFYMEIQNHLMPKLKEKRVPIICMRVKTGNLYRWELLLGIIVGRIILFFPLRWMVIWWFFLSMPNLDACHELLFHRVK